MGRINAITRKTLIAAGFALCSTAAQAGDTATLVQPCLEMQISHERLACYDGVAKTLGLNAVAGKVSGDLGDWDIHQWASPLDDSQNIMATLAASDTIPDMFGRDIITPTLSVRCKEGKMDAFISWKRYISTQDVRQTFRFDKTPAYSQKWSISTDHEALFAYRNDIDTFNARLFSSSLLYVQVTPYGENPVGVRFHLNGSRVVLLKALQACSPG